MRPLLLLCCSTLVFGQGTETKKTAGEYEVHTQAGAMGLGAEFMVHSFSRGEASYITKDFLVVEVALFPPKDTTYTVQAGQFTLRLNGKKILIAQPPELVAAGLQHPEWQDRPYGEADARINNTGVMIGGPPRTPPLPGNNPPGTIPPDRVPIPRDNPSGITKERVDAPHLAIETALVEGDHHAPTSGFLYFPFTAKISSIKSLELLYGDTVLKLK